MGCRGSQNLVNTQVVIKTAKGDVEKKQFANIALRHRLFVSGWQLSHFLQLVRDLDYECEISLAYIGNEPVGVSLLLFGMIPLPYKQEKSNQISVFVRKAYRNQGIGTKLFNTLKDKKTQMFAREGISLSRNFYEKRNVYIAEW